jgi:hypothetical protein
MRPWRDIEGVHEAHLPSRREKNFWILLSFTVPVVTLIVLTWVLYKRIGIMQALIISITIGTIFMGMILALSNISEEGKR